MERQTWLLLIVHLRVMSDSEKSISELLRDAVNCNNGLRLSQPLLLKPRLISPHVKCKGAAFRCLAVIALIVESEIPQAPT